MREPKIKPPSKILEIPDQIEIEGVVWKIFRESNAPNNLKKRGKKLLARGCYGECFGSHRAIVLSDALQGEHLEETFLHEILHALFYTCGLYSHLGDELEEHLIETLDAPMMRVLRSLVWK